MEAGIGPRRDRRTESLREQIEVFAPKGYAKEREALFEKLHDLCVERPVLVHILAAWDLSGPREYWRERRNVEKYWRTIEHSPVVRRSPSLADITFFEPKEFYCPHRIKRKECLRIGEAVEQTKNIAEQLQCRERELQSWRRRERNAEHSVDAIRDGVAILESRIRRLRALEEKQHRFLTKKGIESVDHVEHCKSTLRTPLPIAATPPGRGRPRETAQVYLLSAVGNLLVESRLSRRRAVETVNKILRFCLGRKASTGSLLRQWQKKRAK